MGWIVFLPFLILLVVWNKRINKGGGGGGKLGGRFGGGGGGKFKDVIAVITLALAFIAGTGLAFTFLGRWYAAFVGWMGSGAASLTGEAGLARAIPIAVAFGLVATVVFDVLKDRVADKGAQHAAMLLPATLVLVVGGLMNQTGGGTVQTVVGQMASLVTRLGG